MTLKERVDLLLKEKRRSMSWLAKEMGMTDDGLRLALVRESIKYGDIVKLCAALEVRVSVVFEKATKTQMGTNSRDDGQLVKMLKAQLKDKERIIELMTKQLEKRLTRL